MNLCQTELFEIELFWLFNFKLMQKLFKIQLFLCMKMGSALNNLQWLLCHKTKLNKTKQNWDLEYTDCSSICLMEFFLSSTLFPTWFDICFNWSVKGTITRVTKDFCPFLVCSAYIISWRKQFIPWEVPTVGGSIVLDSPLTRYALLDSMWRLKPVLLNLPMR